MKFILLLALISLGLHASCQESPTALTHCQMSVDEILGQQSFDIDEPISEDARYIFFAMYSDLNLIYTAELQNNTVGLPALIASFETSLENATALSLNFSMFQDDITHVESITP